MAKLHMEVVIESASMLRKRYAFFKGRLIADASVVRCSYSDVPLPRPGLSSMVANYGAALWCPWQFQFDESNLGDLTLVVTISRRTILDSIGDVIASMLNSCQFSKKCVGSIRIPVKDLFDDYFSNGDPRAYREGASAVCSTSGKIRGFLYFGYRFGEGDPEMMVIRKSVSSVPPLYNPGIKMIRQSAPPPPPRRATLPAPLPRGVTPTAPPLPGNQNSGTATPSAQYLPAE